MIFLATTLILGLFYFYYDYLIHKQKVIQALKILEKKYNDLNYTVQVEVRYLKLTNEILQASNKNLKNNLDNKKINSNSNLKLIKKKDDEEEI